MPGTVVVERHGGNVAVLTLNRPDAYAADSDTGRSPPGRGVRRTPDLVPYCALPNRRARSMHRVDRMNAFNWEMAADLESALQEADADDTVRAIVLTGRGKGAPGQRGPRPPAATKDLRKPMPHDKPAGEGWGVCAS